MSHVYNMESPEDATAYLHRAGRSGRIGSPVSGADSINYNVPAQIFMSLLIHSALGKSASLSLVLT